MSELPTGWAFTTLSDITEHRSGNSKLIKGKLSSEPTENSYPAFSASGQDVWRADYEHEGDAIIVSAVGARCGKCFVARDKWSAIANTHIVRPVEEAVDIRYLWFHLNNESFWVKGGSAQPFVKVAATFQEPFSLPPIDEQRRIVTKLNQIFERTTSAREELAHIPTLVEHYKQAILRKAFSGELTADWREKQGRTEAVTSTVGELVSDIRYGTAKKCYPEEHGVAVLRIPNVSGGQIVLSDLKYAELQERELRKLALQIGDILIVRSNGSPELVGRPAIVTEQAEGLAYAGYLIRLRPKAESIVPDYLKLMLESPQIRAVVEVAARSTSGVHNINSEELAGLSVPCPQLDEQREIVRLISEAFDWIERVSGERDKAATMLDHLDSGLLGKAFKGELVPQHPADEPAEQLLKRIRSERTAQTPARRGRRARAGA